MLDLKEGEYCVDGVVSLSSIFHTARENYEGLLKTFASFMPNGGAILTAMSSGEWEAANEKVHGGNMFWSHYGAERNAELIENAGFNIVLNEIDGAANERHQIIIALLN
jgi:hypothetical protein